MHISWVFVWSSIQVYVLMVTYNCSCIHNAGRASLAVCAKGSNCSLLQSILKTATHTLTSHASCMSAKTPSPYSEILCAVFSLLANCSHSHECRAVLKKVLLYKICHMQWSAYIFTWLLLCCFVILKPESVFKGIVLDVPPSYLVDVHVHPLPICAITAH